MSKKPLKRPDCRLYLVSPSQIELASFVEQLKMALDGGDVGSFQLRLKNTSEDDILRAAQALMPLCHARDVAFIMNDSPALALKSDADGVHLGQDDGKVKAARALLGEQRVIGVSCHDSRHLAMEAGEDGADYVAFGAFYPTKSKSAEALAKYISIVDYICKDAVRYARPLQGIRRKAAEVRLQRYD
jgi:thiamine-phosphate pyrophosphorylase